MCCECGLGLQLHTLDKHTGDVYSVAFSPTGEHIVSGARDKHAKIWNTATGFMVCRFLSLMFVLLAFLGV